MVSYILAVLVGIIALGIDQYTKAYIVANCTLAQTYEFFPPLLDITYIHNEGGAWGILSGYTWILLSLTVLIMLVCVALLLKFGVKDKLIFWSVSLVLSGGVGNMIDRISRGVVVDFLHFTFFPQFPVFNIADCCIVIGAGLLMLYFILGMIKDAKNAKGRIQENGEN